ncbi:uncharacterized protein [Ptychodera flava]|uniref:uncharacterized protein isoform X2 n=1 Tax=Ptychodera flava TaxID=63121 RepID=UPI00396A31D8
MSTVSLDSVQSADSSLPNGKALIIQPGVEREQSSGDSVSTLDCASETDRSPSVDMSATYSPDNNAVWEENGSRDVGELIGWGCGEFGQHGHGSGGDVSAEQGLLKIFSRTGDPLSCTKIIACGASHTVIVTYSNQIYAWGNGNSGQLGCGDRETHSDPQRVYLSEQRVKVKGVACGSRHTIVWLENGKCYSFGNNYNAQLGYDFKVKNYKENQRNYYMYTGFSVRTSIMPAWCKKGKTQSYTVRKVLPHVLLHHRDKGRFLDEVKPHLLRTLQHRHVTQVACGERHTMFLFDTGTVAGCGCNANGQIGIGSREEVVTPRFLEDLDNVEYIACGAHHSMCVNASGEVHVWGHAKPCGSLKEDFLHPQIKPVPGSAVFRVAGGTSHCLALTENGAVYTWGSGVDGQLGHGKKVKFLSQPKKLLRNVFQGAKVSQISCSEQYSAVLTALSSAMPRRRVGRSRKKILQSWQGQSTTVVSHGRN